MISQLMELSSLTRVVVYRVVKQTSRHILSVCLLAATKFSSSYPKGLAVGSDVGWRPVGHTLYMQSLSLMENIFLWGLSPAVEKTVHPQQLTGRKRHLDTHPTKKTVEM